jgi:intermembrane space import and assembly protein 40
MDYSVAVVIFLMLRQFTRLRISLSRPLSTVSQQQTRSTSRRLYFALAASAVTGTYIAWHLASRRHRVALDDVDPTGELAPHTLRADMVVLNKDILPRARFSSTGTQLPPPQPVADAPPFPQPEPSPEVSASASAPTSDPPTTQEEGDAQDVESGGAFNPTTGEINWDCPCLGGMAHGPCGPQFREAFSCFVFSQKEPKGFDCIEKFEAMQNCFREHPDIYADGEF